LTCSCQDARYLPAPDPKTQASLLRLFPSALPVLDTVAIVGPDLLQRRLLPRILKRIEREGFQLQSLAMATLSAEQAEQVAADAVDGGCVGLAARA
jgi:hypothetical protein